VVARLSTTAGAAETKTVAARAKAIDESIIKLKLSEKVVVERKGRAKTNASL
jgi:hypothetical protein